MQLNIIVKGTGYVGLVSGACFAAMGHHVRCEDKNKEKIALLTNGHIPIYEPGLKELVDETKLAGTLQFREAGFQDKQLPSIILVAVGTPTDPKTGLADLSALQEVANDIADTLSSHTFIIIKSTVPVGTGRKMAEWILAKNPKAQFEMVSNPEFLREGSAVFDFMNPDRIIIGAQSQKAHELLAILYQPLINKGIQLVHTDIETSELIKYTANCFLATKIAFINEIAALAEKLNANIDKVVEGIGLDKRIGLGYLQVGPGFGGSCFPKDTLALASLAKAIGNPLSIIDAVIQSNIDRKLQMVTKIINACGGSVKDKVIAVLGITFKANTDDTRDSAALTIIQGLKDRGAIIRVYDPMVTSDNFKTENPNPNPNSNQNQNQHNWEWGTSLYDTVEGANAVVIATEWDEFKHLDWDRFKKAMHNKDLSLHVNHSSLHLPLVIDLRNLFSLTDPGLEGIRYISLGRPESLMVKDKAHEKIKTA